MAFCYSIKAKSPIIAWYSKMKKVGTFTEINFFETIATILVVVIENRPRISWTVLAFICMDVYKKHVELYLKNLCCNNLLTRA